MRSLNARLLLLVLGATMAIWLTAVAVSWVKTRHEINELLDGHLAQAAALLIAQTSHDMDEIDLEHTPLLHRDARKVAFQVFERGTQLRLHSVNAPNTPLGTATEGFDNRIVEGVRWRVYTTWTREGDLLIHVAERSEVRGRIAREMGYTLLGPMLIAFPLLALLIWAAIRYGLRPLNALAAEVGSRTPDNLKPVVGRRLPREIEPLIDQLNALLERMAASFARERRFTADAAHELRTPIAAIKAQAQVARGASVVAERVHALDQVILASDRAARLIDQMLTLARLEGEATIEFEPCRLQAIAREIVAGVAPMLLEKGIGIEVDGDETATVRGVPGLLHALIGNLVDNAARHGARNIAVHVRRDADDILLEVSDDGPGISPQARALVFERFFRLAEAGEGGSGLGLSIVARIAELHGAQVTLADAPTIKESQAPGHASPAASPGLLVRLRFPQAIASGTTSRNPG